jgi:hypothetical protein
MAGRVAWFLNLDADVELGAPAPYEPARGVKRAMVPHVERLASSLVAPGDLLVDEQSVEGVAEGLLGRAFCPTPRAVAVLLRSGAAPEPYPPVEVLRRVNSRAFASELGATLSGADFVTNLAVAVAKLRSDPVIGESWRAKYAFGMTGRNQRVIQPSSVGDDDVDFVRRGLAQPGGGLQIEPDVAIESEYALHGFLEGDGSLAYGSIVQQRCNARGAWLSTTHLGFAEGQLGEVAEQLRVEAARVGEALFRAGYFGPYGVDSYTYRDRGGASHFQVRSEINARYSMGFGVGFGLGGSAGQPR